jgi:transcriptional regulator with XRE-family HTH domain
MENIIISKTIENIRLLRETYALPVSEMSWLLGLKSKGSIYQMEKGIALPSFAVMERLVCCFGVSIDWLLGLSSIPYTETTMLAAEQSLIEDFKSTGQAWTNVIDTPKQAKIIPIKYGNYEQRKMSYSLAVRSDIVLLMRTTWIREFNNPSSNIKDYFYAVLPKVLQKEHRNKKLNKFKEAIEPLNKLLRSEKEPALYDLTAKK